MKLLLFIVVMLAGSISSAQTISGKVLDLDTHLPLAGTQLYLVGKELTEDTVNSFYWLGMMYPIIKQTVSNAEGEYRFEGLESRSYNLIASYRMPAILNAQNEELGYSCREDIDSSINLSKNPFHTRQFTLMVTCPYDKYKEQTFCPVCKKADKVLPILFGLIIPIFDSTGKPLEPIGEYISGGCTPDPYCNPFKRCLRCERDF